MDAKNKAKELVEKCTFERKDGHENYVAKQCALIAVDELINSWCAYTGMYEQQFFDSELKYWEQVKTEIEKL